MAIKADIIGNNRGFLIFYKKEESEMNIWVPSKRYCQNCGEKIIGFRDNKGGLKLTCPYCFTFYNCKKISRRKEKVEVVAPKNQTIK